MKKQFTKILLLLCAVFASNSVMAQKKVLFVYANINASDYVSQGASAPGDDAIFRMFAEDATINAGWVNVEYGVTAPATSPNVLAQSASNVGANTVGSPLDLTGIDLVVLTEQNGSGVGSLKPGNILHVDQVSIPIIYAKTYAWVNGKLTNQATNSSIVRTQELSMLVEDATSDLFNGLTVANGDEVSLFRSTADDKGNEGAYTIDFVKDITITTTDNSSTLLASVPQMADKTTSIAINYFPAGTKIGEGLEGVTTGVLGVNAMAIPFSFGAQIKKDGGNVTSEFLTIWRNAAYMLTGLTPPETLYSNPDWDDYELVSETVTYDFRDGTLLPAEMQANELVSAYVTADRITSADGSLEYRINPRDEFNGTTWGLDMKGPYDLDNVFMSNIIFSIIYAPLSTIFFQIIFLGGY